VNRVTVKVAFFAGGSQDAAAAAPELVVLVVDADESSLLPHAPRTSALNAASAPRLNNLRRTDGLTVLDMLFPPVFRTNDDSTSD
jgi:hypothetical protein